MKIFFPSVKTHLPARAGNFLRAAAPSNPAAPFRDKRQNSALKALQGYVGITLLQNPDYGALQRACNGILIAASTAHSRIHSIFQMSAFRLLADDELSPASAGGRELAPNFPGG